MACATCGKRYKAKAKAASSTQGGAAQANASFKHAVRGVIKSDVPAKPQEPSKKEVATIEAKLADSSTGFGHFIKGFFKNPEEVNSNNNSSSSNGK